MRCTGLVAHAAFTASCGPTVIISFTSKGSSHPRAPAVDSRHILHFTYSKRENKQKRRLRPPTKHRDTENTHTQNPSPALSTVFRCSAAVLCVRAGDCGLCFSYCGGRVEIRCLPLSCFPPFSRAHLSRFKPARACCGSRAYCLACDRLSSNLCIR